MCGLLGRDEGWAQIDRARDALGRGMGFSEMFSAQRACTRRATCPLDLSSVFERVRGRLSRGRAFGLRVNTVVCVQAVSMARRRTSKKRCIYIYLLTAPRCKARRQTNCSNAQHRRDTGAHGLAHGRHPRHIA